MPSVAAVFQFLAISVLTSVIPAISMSYLPL